MIVRIGRWKFKDKELRNEFYIKNFLCLEGTEGDYTK
jgi:hypothetical protein